ncbi:MAG TPA: cobalt-precorrin-6A reductase [Mycobacterium sp.]|nr:cobalt-precorrin-6A reductase [Mycobacterium sp.]
MRVLLLGGTAEARELAAALVPDVDVISSLAGRVPNPALPAGRVRIGGFGGAGPLRDYLRDNGVDAVVDATHPFAAAITARAAEVCAEIGLPHLVLARPAWDTPDAIVVSSVAEAADKVDEFTRVFLTTGRSDVAAFAGCRAWFLIRVVTEPDPGALPARHTLVLSRGPYRYPDEVALMHAHRIDLLVTKNSGGGATRAKLDAAATLGVPVVMVARPPLPPGVATVATVDAAAAWIRAIRRGCGAFG